MRFHWVLALVLATTVGCGGNATRKASSSGGSAGQASETSGSSSDADSSASSDGSGGGGGWRTTGAGGSSACNELCVESACPDGDLATPDGECCPTCSCAAVSCVSVDCGPGEVQLFHPGACCPSCEAILDCETDGDCLLADRPRSCCGCPEAINYRALEHDSCWFDVDAPRELPEECYPEEYCDAVCGACAPIAGVRCVNSLCAVVECSDDEPCEF